VALYAIGDLHLGHQVDKPMGIFGEKWIGHEKKLRASFAELLCENDVTVLVGDTSWAMAIEDSLEDFRYIDSLPGKKYILKGNHDYWWSTAKKIEVFFRAGDIHSIELLHNNCHMYGNVAICGTKGWMPSTDDSAHSEKIRARELQRLEFSLKEAEKQGATEKVVFMHYPPIGRTYQWNEATELMEGFGVSRCCYGHLHGRGHRDAFLGVKNGVEYSLVASDFIDFRPIRIFD